jgi:hypothetical protein
MLLILNRKTSEKQERKPFGHQQAVHKFVDWNAIPNAKTISSNIKCTSLPSAGVVAAAPSSDRRTAAGFDCARRGSSTVPALRSSSGHRGFARDRGLAPPVRVRYLISHIHLDSASCREQFPEGSGRASGRARAGDSVATAARLTRIERVPRRGF